MLFNRKNNGEYKQENPNHRSSDNFNQCIHRPIIAYGAVGPAAQKNKKQFFVPGSALKKGAIAISTAINPITKKTIISNFFIS